MFKKKKIYNVTPLTLKDSEPFAQGVNRLCFIHPDDASLCIKVVKEGSIEALRSKRSFFENLRPDSYFDDNLNEYKAYQQAAISGNEGIIYDHIPRCYGWQDTDLGMGLVLDYYSKGDNQPCVTLRSYLQTHGLNEEIDAKLGVLADYLRKTLLMTKNIVPHNVVVASDGKLKIIDGIGALSALSIAHTSKAAKRHYINRRIDRMLLRVKWEVGDRKKGWSETEKTGAL